RRATRSISPIHRLGWVPFSIELSDKPQCHQESPNLLVCLLLLPLAHPFQR
ncbi:unnamed protein product, partial [Linum tenue]